MIGDLASLLSIGRGTPSSTMIPRVLGVDGEATFWSDKIVGRAGRVMMFERIDGFRGGMPVLLLKLERNSINNKAEDLRRGMSGLEEMLELVGCIGGGRADTTETIRSKEASTASLEATILKLSSTELTGGRSLLLQHLLLMGIRVANLDNMLFSTRFADRSVVELPNHFFTDVTRLEAIHVFCQQILKGTMRSWDTVRNQRLVHCHDHREGCAQSTPYKEGSSLKARAH